MLRQQIDILKKLYRILQMSSSLHPSYTGELLYGVICNLERLCMQLGFNVEDSWYERDWTDESA